MLDLEFIERVKTLSIIAMFSDDELMERLVLKGGNALDIVYKASTRASADLDFSIDGDFEDLDSISEKFRRVIKSTTMKSVVRQVRFLVYPMEIVSASPFCRARAEVRRLLASTFPGHGRYSRMNRISSVCFVFAEPLADLRHAHRYRRLLVSCEGTIFKGSWAKRFD